jgi:phenylacetate-CoA ligase
MDFYGSILKHIVYPLWLRHEGQYEILDGIDAIAALERLRPDQLRSRQLDLLRRLMRHAVVSIPYYRELFAESGFDPEDLHALSDLKRLPVLTKEIINHRREEMVSDSHRRSGNLRRSVTGGSTGTPLVFYRDLDCLIYRRALDHYFDQTIGFRIGDRQALLWGNPTDIPIKPSRKRELFDRLIWRRIGYLPVVIDQRELEAFTSALAAYKPQLIKAYPSLLYFYCRYLIDNRLPPPQIPVATVTAEQLFDFQREVITATLGCELFEKYGSREIGTAAVECTQHDGLHLLTDSLIVEVEPIPQYDFAAVGKLIVTDLRNYAMPLIRYEIGDLAALDETPCPCGLPFPRLRNIQGRTTDIFYRRDGTPLVGIELTDAITYSGLTTQAQIHQERPGEITVRVVDLEQVPREQLDYITNRLSAILDTDGKVSLVSVARIDRDPSGKFRYAVSDVGECSED